MAIPDLIPRRAFDVVVDLLGAARGVVVNGPRQSGKSELLKLVADEKVGSYVTLDEPIELRSARLDPSGFLSGLSRPFLIDEIQRGGDPLVLAIKRVLDSDRQSGQCVLAGSTRFLFEPRISESLAGRVRFVELWPLAVGEIEGSPQRFIDMAFSGHLESYTPNPVARREIGSMIVRGGFPEVVTQPTERFRQAFFADYANTLTQRDIRELSSVHRTTDLLTVLRLIAARTANELNVASFAQDAGLGPETTRRYLPLLATLYLHHLLPAWSNNFSSRAVRRPKIHFTDTGLACHLLGVGVDRFTKHEPILGHLFETFVVNEIIKQITWNESPVRAFHWRDRNGAEVDLVLERTDGSVFAIECKLADDTGPDDFQGLRILRDHLGERFVGGIVLHLGNRVRSFGDRLSSVPVDAVWRASPHSAASRVR